MDRGEKIIFVAGATGRQGGASARHLLADGWRVRALTRDPEQPSARALRELGAEVVQGDLTDRCSLDPLLEGVWGVHSVETPAEAGFEAELREGGNLVDAARDAGVRHFVYSSHANAGEPNPPEPWVRTKQSLEEYLKASDMPWTIWRPALFMDDYLAQRDDIVEGVLRGPEPPDMIKQLIAVDDLGRFVAMSFADPDAWLGKATEIAGDRLTASEAAQVFGRVLQRDVRYEQVEPPKRGPGPRPPWRIVDFFAMRVLVPDIKSLEDWATTVDWRLEGVPGTPLGATARR